RVTVMTSFPFSSAGQFMRAPSGVTPYWTNVHVAARHIQIWYRFADFACAFFFASLEFMWDVQRGVFPDSRPSTSRPASAFAGPKTYSPCRVFKQGARTFCARGPM